MDLPDAPTTRRLVAEASEAVTWSGGKIVGTVYHPISTTDLSSFCRRRARRPRSSALPTQVRTCSTPSRRPRISTSRPARQSFPWSARSRKSTRSALLRRKACSWSSHSAGPRRFVPPVEQALLRQVRQDAEFCAGRRLFGCDELSEGGAG